MPEISRFLGMIMTMYYNDHAPPHFHIRYGEFKAIMAIQAPVIVEGYLSPRAAGLATEWATLHREELMENWALAESLQPLKKIRPLE
jgi:hypothetical protein